jgi:hypothetical protein
MGSSACGAASASRSGTGRPTSFANRIAAAYRAASARLPVAGESTIERSASRIR